MEYLHSFSRACLRVSSVQQARHFLHSRLKIYQSDLHVHRLSLVRTSAAMAPRGIFLDFIQFLSPQNHVEQR